MIKNIRINYKDILEHRKAVVDYAVNNSSVFSVITNSRKKNAHQQLEYSLQPYLIKKIPGIRKWSNNNASNNKMVMNIYESNKATLEILQNVKALEPTIEGVLEDLCFYRNTTIWIATVTHEHLAFVYNANEKDLKFFNNNRIMYYPDTSNDLFILPM